jgi:L-seryl-tRNA(Ser) seleniumtransferase
MPDFRVIPSLDAVMSHADVAPSLAKLDRQQVVTAARAAADELRAAIVAGTASPRTTDDALIWLAARIAHALGAGLAPSLRPVINATGVIIHTNLGRAPLAARAAVRTAELAAGYSNLEYDLAAGGRGRRDVHAEHLLRQLTGAEAGLIVNNNAAATLVVLAALASGREVIVSRGELVEIGGGFRVPDVMRQSGAVLREVGTTNRTRAADYAAAISDRTALILRVHPSNFRVIGFTERPSLDELTALGQRFQIRVAEDLGSGWLGWPDRASLPVALRDEPIVSESIAAGADVVCFSGDKLLGGPQAGIIAGRRDAVDRIRRHPLMRALRVDKLTYAALEATLEEHAIGRGMDAVPVQRMLAMTLNEIGHRADALAAALTASGWTARVIDGVSTVGGGSAPGAEIPTRLVQLTRSGMSADAIEQRLRGLDPPVIARIQDDCVVLDLRTVRAEDDNQLSKLHRPTAAGH